MTTYKRKLIELVAGSVALSVPVLSTSDRAAA